MNYNVNDGISIILSTLLYPERTERCLKSLLQQNEIPLDICILVKELDMDYVKDLADQYHIERCIVVDVEDFSKQFSRIIENCFYEDVLFVRSDSVFEQDACKRLHQAARNTDGLVFNISQIRENMTTNILYPTTYVRYSLFQKEADEFGLSNVYSRFPVVWNMVLKKTILKKAGLQIRNLYRVEQYFFIVRYHACCMDLLADTSIFVYFEKPLSKATAWPRFSFYHRNEIKKMIVTIAEKTDKKTAKILERDFIIHPYMKSIQNNNKSSGYIGQQAGLIIQLMGFNKIFHSQKGDSKV